MARIRKPRVYKSRKPSISVSGALYRRANAYCDLYGMALPELLEQALADKPWEAVK